MVDATLVERLRAGEPAAFDEAYAAYRPRLFGFLVRLTRRRDLAEDLLQETWIRLAKNARRLAPDTNLRAWLYTVARNLYLSHRRWVLIDLDRLAALTPPKGLGADALTPFDLASASETERRLEAALSRIPLKYREVLLLVGVDGMEHAEAAAILELKPDALRQRLLRARGMLETALQRSVTTLEKESIA
jgi:RNA polymerase sigma factor (sigma-70 family)